MTSHAHQPPSQHHHHHARSSISKHHQRQHQVQDSVYSNVIYDKQISGTLILSQQMLYIFCKGLSVNEFLHTLKKRKDAYLLKLPIIL